MFQDEQIKYLFIGPILVVTIMTAGGFYEAIFGDHKTVAATIAATAHWSGTALALTITALALWRALEMFNKQKYLEQGRQEERHKWLEWTRRKEEAEREGRPFNEPNPDERERQAIRRD